MFSDFLRVIKESGATEFTGYGISVRFPANNFSSSFIKPTDSPVPVSIGLRAEPVNENPWNNPNLWSGQQGKRLRLDGSLG